MTPVFGRGVVFDATPEQRKQALRNQSLRDSIMRGHAEMIAAETSGMMAKLGDEGEIDLLDFFCRAHDLHVERLPDRERVPRGADAGVLRVFYELEKGTDAIAYVNPYLPLPVFRRRDRARARWWSCSTAYSSAARSGSRGREARAVRRAARRFAMPDGRPRFTIDQVTGMFISMMFAGHHTTSGTAAWTLIELLRNPRVG